MKDHQDDDQRLEQWAEYRRDTPEAPEAFTRQVMDRIAANQPERSAPTQPAARCPRLALTAACAAAGIGKVWVLLHLTI
ncbi:MAG: hypothetical protein ACR2RV_23795 [Verrucomicrobiales bacterium]